jgi:uncharacterized protein
MTHPTPSKDLLRYDLLVQDALKGVVRKVLVDAGRDGLPGDHHFYISFRTDFPGVRLSQRMREKYPEEMTIVLQHQFWDLGITEHTFEVGLSFSGIPERLLIPFDALVGFFDPSVQFGLKFELNGEASALPALPPPEAAKPAPARLQNPLRGAGSEPTELKSADSKPPESKRDAKAKPKVASEQNDDDQTSAPDTPDDDKGSAQVLSLDAFRKKP